MVLFGQRTLPVPLSDTIEAAETLRSRPDTIIRPEAALCSSHFPSPTEPQPSIATGQEPLTALGATIPTYAANGSCTAEGSALAPTSPDLHLVEDVSEAFGLDMDSTSTRNVLTFALYGLISDLYDAHPDIKMDQPVTDELFFKISEFFVTGAVSLYRLMAQQHDFEAISINGFECKADDDAKKLCGALLEDSHPMSCSTETRVEGPPRFVNGSGLFYTHHRCRRSRNETREWDVLKQLKSYVKASASKREGLLP